jgi:hypothetical protein
MYISNRFENTQISYHSKQFVIALRSRLNQIYCALLGEARSDHSSCTTREESWSKRVDCSRVLSASS